MVGAEAAVVPEASSRMAQGVAPERQQGSAAAEPLAAVSSQARALSPQWVEPAAAVARAEAAKNHKPRQRAPRPSMSEGMNRYAYASCRVVYFHWDLVVYEIMHAQTARWIMHA